MQYSLSIGLVQHFAVPFLQALGFRDLLIGRVTMEDIVIAFTRRTRPDVSRNVSAVEKLKFIANKGK